MKSYLISLEMGENINYNIETIFLPQDYQELKKSLESFGKWGALMHHGENKVWYQPF